MLLCLGKSSSPELLSQRNADCRGSGAQASLMKSPPHSFSGNPSPSCVAEVILKLSRVPEGVSVSLHDEESVFALSCDPSSATRMPS
ncbi:hypothetical protein BaRGS_00007015 [Batillaria attramentaria]|uniref:Uncharacterized protein n=1 Tax=Batillaria attramentaria TaxID=370345 RepID=A0ABD0LQ01_9CAEN